MVGHIPLEDGILVQIQVPQQGSEASAVPSAVEGQGVGFLSPERSRGTFDSQHVVFIYSSL